MSEPIIDEVKSWGAGATTINVSMTPGAFVADEQEFADRVRAAMADRLAEVTRQYRGDAAPKDDPVLRCPHPECNATLTAGPGSMCSDPWCPSGGNTSTVSAADLVEEDDGPAPTPEQQACPECLAGKHDNCGGRILDESSVNEPGPVKYIPCPCAGETHPESLG